MGKPEDVCCPFLCHSECHKPQREKSTLSTMEKHKESSMLHLKKQRQKNPFWISFHGQFLSLNKSRLPLSGGACLEFIASLLCCYFKETRSRPVRFIHLCSAQLHTPETRVNNTLVIPISIVFTTLCVTYVCTEFKPPPKNQPQVSLPECRLVGLPSFHVFHIWEYTKLKNKTTTLRYVKSPQHARCRGLVDKRFMQSEWEA